MQSRVISKHGQGGATVRVSRLLAANDPIDRLALIQQQQVLACNLNIVCLVGGTWGINTNQMEIWWMWGCGCVHV